MNPSSAEEKTQVGRMGTGWRAGGGVGSGAIRPDPSERLPLAKSRQLHRTHNMQRQTAQTRTIPKGIQQSPEASKLHDRPPQSQSCICAIYIRIPSSSPGVFFHMETRGAVQHCCVQRTDTGTGDFEHDDLILRVITEYPQLTCCP